MSETIVQDVYLGNLSYDISDEDLYEILEQFGPVTDVNHIQKKGIAYVKFAQEEDAEMAIKSLEGVPFLGRKLIMDWAKPKKMSTRK
jgi:RNA recognition motif-containing protein